MSYFAEDITNGKTEELNERKITVQDIITNSRHYQELMELQREYEESITGRKQLAIEIREKTALLKSFAFYLSNTISRLDGDYLYKGSYISDLELSMNLLLRLANEKENKYALKRFSGAYHQDSENNPKDNIWVIADKNLLRRISNRKFYTGYTFANISNEILSKGSSLIVFDEMNSPDNIACPWKWNSDNVIKYEMMVEKPFSHMKFYLYNDELRKASNEFRDFIEKNGADIEGISEEELFEVIHKKENNPPKKRTLKKQEIRYI